MTVSSEREDTTGAVPVANIQDEGRQHETDHPTLSLSILRPQTNLLFDSPGSN